MSGGGIEAVLAAAMERRCPHCLRMQATEHDWEMYADDEGVHLCWEEPEVCGWVAKTTAAKIQAAAVLAWLDARLTEGDVVEAVDRAVEQYEGTVSTLEDTTHAGYVTAALSAVRGVLGGEGS